MIYCFDIDGTICTNTNGEYESAVPFPDVIEMVNELYDKGHTINFFTARGYTTGIDWEKVTKSQFNKWGVKYHQLFFGKPNADIYVDDKCINVSDFKKKL